MGALIGVDVGQLHETSGICAVVEDRRFPKSVPASHQDLVYSQRERHFIVKLLKRVPSGTPYPEIAEQVGIIAMRTTQELGSSGRVYVNATGTGEPIVNLIKSHCPSFTIFATYFNYGEQQSVEKRVITLGKALLVSQLQLLLQTNRIHLPRTAEAELLAKELLNYQVQVDENANDRYGAFKVGSSDELVTALGMVVSGPAPGRVWGPDGQWA